MDGKSEYPSRDREVQLARAAYTGRCGSEASGIGPVRMEPEAPVRVGELGGIIARADELEKLSMVLCDRVSYIEHRLLSPVPQDPHVRAGPTQAEPGSLLVSLDTRICNARRSLERAFETVERLQRELCD